MATHQTRSALASALFASAATLISGAAAQAQVKGPGTTENPAAAAAPETALRTAPTYESHEERPSAEAVRTADRITVDGRLDEPAWMTAPPVTDFWQVDPDEGTPITEPTEVRFLYDDDAIYVGAWLFDNDGTIVSRMARRDTGLPDIDLFAVHFDSYHTHRSSYRFTVAASGAIRDLAAGANDRLTGGDRSWNPVWEVRTTVTPGGWYAEMRIPFSQLRFSQDEEQTWGLQLERKIRPSQENTIWSFVAKDQPQGRITFGHLTGLRGIKPGRRLELLPYVGGSAEYTNVPLDGDASFANPFRSGSDYFGNGGLDLKYRLTSNLTLDGTVNPDFGQVEVDPAVINLTAFETRFDERRPFFVEGAEIFEFGDHAPEILYSRRIGRQPHGSVPGEAVYDLTPSATTILGAAKLSGKTANGWSLAALNAVTAREQAFWRDIQDTEETLEVEPLTNYFAGRARREIRGGQTTFGILATAVNRDLSSSPLEGKIHSSAYSAGLDFSHDFADREWHLSGSFSPSYVSGSSASLIATQRASSRYYQRPDADYLGVDSTATSLFGYSALAALRKQAGLWRFQVSGSAISPGYEVNDIGFMTRVDRIFTQADFGYDQTRPGTYFRNWNMTVAPRLAWNYGGDLIEASTTLSARAQLHNFARVSGRFSYNPAKMNQRLTRGGPLTRDPSGYSGSLNYSTVNQASVTWRLGAQYGSDRSGAWQRGTNFSLNFRTGGKFDMSIGPSFNQSRRTAQYITSVSDPTATSTFGRRYVFGELDQSTLSINTRINVTLSPQTTIEIFAQPFLSSGNYENLKELAAPRTFDFNRYGAGAGTIVAVDEQRHFQIDPDGGGPASQFQVDNKNFNVRSLISNAVFRWEWKPGSTLFLVWQQSRSGRVVASDPDSPFSRVGNFQLGRDTSDLFGLSADNILLIKVSYWLNP